MFERRLQPKRGVLLQMSAACCDPLPASAQLYADDVHCTDCSMSGGSLTADIAEIEISSDSSFRFNLEKNDIYPGEKIAFYADKPETILLTGGDKILVHWSRARVRASNVLISKALWSRVPSELVLTLGGAMIGFIGWERSRIIDYAKRLLHDPEPEEKA
jgi:hypothetical protein